MQKAEVIDGLNQKEIAAVALSPDLIHCSMPMPLLIFKATRQPCF